MLVGTPTTLTPRNPSQTFGNFPSLLCPQDQTFPPQHRGLLHVCIIHRPPQGHRAHTQVPPHEGHTSSCVLFFCCPLIMTRESLRSMSQTVSSSRTLWLPPHAPCPPVLCWVSSPNFTPASPATLSCSGLRTWPRSQQSLSQPVFTFDCSESSATFVLMKQGLTHWCMGVIGFCPDVWSDILKLWANPGHWIYLNISHAVIPKCTFLPIST